MSGTYLYFHQVAANGLILSTYPTKLVIFQHWVDVELVGYMPQFTFLKCETEQFITELQLKDQTCRILGHPNGNKVSSNKMKRTDHLFFPCIFDLEFASLIGNTFEFQEDWVDTETASKYFHGRPFEYDVEKDLFLLDHFCMKYNTPMKLFFLPYNQLYTHYLHHVGKWTNAKVDAFRSEVLNFRDD